MTRRSAVIYIAGLVTYWGVAIITMVLVLDHHHVGQPIQVPLLPGLVASGGALAAVTAGYATASPESVFIARLIKLLFGSEAPRAYRALQPHANPVPRWTRSPAFRWIAFSFLLLVAWLIFLWLVNRHPTT